MNDRALKKLTMASRVCLASAAIFVGLTVSAPHFGLGVATAQKSKTPVSPIAGCEKFKEPRRRLPALKPKTTKMLKPVDDLINPPIDEKTGKPVSEPDPEKALPILEKVISRCKDCSEYEKGQMDFRMATIQTSVENYKKAIQYYEKVVANAEKLISFRQERDMIYTIAQLHMVSEDYDKSLATFKRWEKTCPPPSRVNETYYAMLAQINYQKNNKKSAMSYINKAIGMVESEGKIPQESWYRLKMAMFAEKEDYKNAIVVMEKILFAYPKIKNWTELSTLYAAVGRSKEQRGMLDALNVMGELKKASQARNYAALLMNEDAPYPAAKVLRKAIDKKIIEEKPKILEALASAYRQSQETEDSLVVMEKAARMSDQGKIYAYLAAIYIDAEKFKEAHDATKKALTKGGLRSKSQVYLFQGVSLMNMKKYDSAISALSKVTEKRYRKSAQQLVRYCQAEKRREADLKA